ncbi:hypothetical protein F4859DRAFT_468675 [Xylaria cf. heliscus]|nr:hypothetical protein F4859DRAFT_468675 [Xylaria cf. heliscus]
MYPETGILDCNTDKLYWDPGNLLQIISDEDEYVGIQCVSRTRRVNGAIELASMMPSETLTNKLDHLADPCLCPFHLDQKHSTVERWITVVKRAAKQYNYLQKSAVEEHNKTLISDLYMLRTGGELALGESNQFIRIVKNIMLSHDGEAALFQERLKIAKIMVKVVQAAKDMLRISLQTDNNDLREEVESLRRKSEELCISQKSVADQFQSASTKINTLYSEIQCLSHEIEARDQSLQQSHVELQKERDRGSTLQDRITTMGQRITVPEADISTC